MYPINTSVLERRVVFPSGEGGNIPLHRESQTGNSRARQPFTNLLEKAIQWATTIIMLFGGWLRSLYPVLLFLAEASMAARGYMIMPSVANSDKGTKGNDCLMNQDL